MSGLDYAVRDKVLWMALLALCLVSAAIYVFRALPAMPDTVPVHWGVGGVADGWDSKGSTVFMGAVLPLLVLALLFAVPFFDPRGRSFNRFKGIYQGFAAAMTLFMVVMGWMAPLTALGLLPEGGGISINVISFGFLGLLLVGLGVVMPRIEPNYTFGVRVPWTPAVPRELAAHASLRGSGLRGHGRGHARVGALLVHVPRGHVGGASGRHGARRALQLPPLEGCHPLTVNWGQSPINSQRVGACPQLTARGGGRRASPRCVAVQASRNRPVVAHQHERPRVGRERPLERLGRVQVQVVGRLVHDDERRGRASIPSASMSLRSSPGLVRPPSRMRSGSELSCATAGEHAPALGGRQSSPRVPATTSRAQRGSTSCGMSSTATPCPTSAALATSARRCASSVDFPAPLGPTMPTWSVLPT